jgi:hypothetical protein
MGLSVAVVFRALTDLAVFPVDAVGLADSERRGGAYSEAADMDAGMFSVASSARTMPPISKAPGSSYCGCRSREGSLRR